MERAGVRGTDTGRDVDARNEQRDQADAERDVLAAFCVRERVADDPCGVAVEVEASDEHGADAAVRVEGLDDCVADDQQRDHCDEQVHADDQREVFALNLLEPSVGRERKRDQPMTLELTTSTLDGLLQRSRRAEQPRDRSGSLVRQRRPRVDTRRSVISLSFLRIQPYEQEGNHARSAVLGAEDHDEEGSQHELCVGDASEMSLGYPYATTCRSCTTYAMISASGKKKRLRMKYPMKLCPLRPATRAGQNAINTQMMKPMIPIPNHMMISVDSFACSTLIVVQHGECVVTEGWVNDQTPSSASSRPDRIAFVKAW